MDHSAGMERKADRDEQIGGVQDQYQRIAPGAPTHPASETGRLGDGRGNRERRRGRRVGREKPDDERQDGHDEEGRVEPVRERRKTPGVLSR